MVPATWLAEPEALRTNEMWWPCRLELVALLPLLCGGHAASQLLAPKHTPAPPAATALPSPDQLAWQDLEFGALYVNATPT